ncbi:DUF4304 domain-containing protein [Mesorhizobium cantuariense]|uniref:DUF4304 domain-containing protein n=1 Tax=Mesorhizobium cantuariense TaxID=1300275 RepID=A0ABV7MR64_9HYPH
MDKKELLSLFNQRLSEHDFIKKSTSWCRYLKESTQVVDLQKSNYGNSYYINICCVPGGCKLMGCRLRRGINALLGSGLIQLSRGIRMKLLVLWTLKIVNWRM